MRLGDLDALRDEVDTWGCNDYDKYDFIEAIDNAPTVPLPDFKEGYKQAIIDGKTNFSRPQGEWIIDPEGIVTCPFCGERHCCKMNFCGNCGAYMKGGNE